MIKNKKSLKFKNKIVVFVLLILSRFLYSQSPPSITAERRPAFCLGSAMKIITDFSIADIDDTTNATACKSGLVTTTAAKNTSEGEILWFNASTGGTQLATGASYTTNVLTGNTSF
tara:strand:+ start:52 stop:399 length:348 start_codon:yes stop_codon:yes gene_type:complete